ncbi:hypothetical protein GCM10022419_119430 [Nonomuraea rosea]|uniref:DUF3631 domain-containing protein n=1 Tax=Nonomuraea rosea TaxID=638574 RepID=A0ABP6ZMC7_9ACTN
MAPHTLVIVADHAGENWPDRARTATLTLTAEADDNDQASARVRLLTNCRTAFGPETALPTAVLLERLKSDPESGWGECGPAGLTAMKLGTMLREYDIRSGNIRFPNGQQAKGYQRADFADAWARYCPSLGPVPDADVVPIERDNRPSRPSLVTAGQSGTAPIAGTA